MPVVDLKDEAISSTSLFAIYREYVKHQYELINHRTAWLGTLQSFLFGTFGFTIQKKAEVVEKLYVGGGTCSKFRFTCESLGYLDLVLVVLCLAGIGSAIVALLALRAASVPISLLFDAWEEHRKSVSGNAVSLLPLLTGGREKRFASLGRTATFYLPITLLGCWVGLLLFTQMSPFFRCTSFLPYAMPFMFPACSTSL